MAKRICELCGVNFSRDMCFGVMLCDECRKIYSSSSKGDQTALEQINQPHFFAHATPKAIALFASYVVDKDAVAYDKAKSEEEYKSNLASLMLTTGVGFDGYVVTKYIDVICEEVVFKNGLGRRLGAGIEDMIAGFTFRDAEMTGTTSLIAEGRMHTLVKFKQTAARLGANAVLGVDFETSMGSDIVRVAVSGTAVKIEKIDAQNNMN